MVVVDRAKRQWDEFSYYLVDAGGQIDIQWFDEAPEVPLLGGIVLILRPKKIFDENYTHEYWQIDE
jgi:hypothetical protein